MRAVTAAHTAAPQRMSVKATTAGKSFRMANAVSAHVAYVKRPNRAAAPTRLRSVASGSLGRMPKCTIPTT